jgi:hypothetical protein
MRRQSFDVVLSGRDAIDTAYRLHREFAVRWIATVTDPRPTCILPPPYGKGWPQGLVDRCHCSYIRRALRAADKVVFPSSRLASYHERALHVNLGSRKLSIPHIGWHRGAPVARKGTFEILYAGGLDRYRLGIHFFRWFADVLRGYPDLGGRIRLTVLGEVAPQALEFINSNGLRHLVNPEGKVCYEESLRRISAADALLLIEAPLEEGIFLPAKFCDYAVARKPLLMFSPEKGAVSDLVGEFAHPGLLGQNEELCKRRIAQFLECARGGLGLEQYLCPCPEIFYPNVVGERLLQECTSFLSASPG